MMTAMTPMTVAFFCTKVWNLSFYSYLCKRSTECCLERQYGIKGLQTWQMSVCESATMSVLHICPNLKRGKFQVVDEMSNKRSRL